MPNPENTPEILHASDIEPTDMPAKINNGADTVLVHKNDSGVLFMRALHEEESLVSVAITQDHVHVTFSDGTQVLHPRRGLHDPSPLPLQAETQQPAKEKEATITVAGSFVQDITFHQVNRKHKNTHQSEKQWLYKFLMRVPNETTDAANLQIVTSLGKSAERYKKMDLHSGEEISVKGYMQHRTNTKTKEETDELYAVTIRRIKPQDTPPGA